MPRRLAVLMLVPLCSTLACTDDAASNDEQAAEAETETETGEEQQATYTWWRDVEPIVADKCMGCHVEGNIGPFSMSTYEKVVAIAPILPASIESGSMPPWPPAEGCNDYSQNHALDDDQRERLLTWIDEGTPEGDPADALPKPDPEPEWVPDAMIEMAEPYTATQAPDDYHCFLIDGPELDATSYVTGFEVYPGERKVVHHVIAYVVDPDQIAEYEGYDAAEEGPGYTCFGGPQGQGGSATSLPRWIGSWAPGSGVWTAPEGSGMRLEPGSKFAVQVHYNTSNNEALPDRTSIGLSLVDEVERPGMILPFTNFNWVIGAVPMTIPAGDPSVSHSFTADRNSQILTFLLADIGASPSDTLKISNAGLHMHTLGVSTKIEVNHGDGSDSCLLQIDDYDFNWQGSYDLSQPVTLGPDDSLSLRCEWDNSPENQPIVDGEQIEPRNVAWGDGTFDEMCLGILYVSE